MSTEMLTVAIILQGKSEDSLLWVAAKVLMFLVPFLLLLRVVMAMREIRLSRRSLDYTADHSFAAILLVSHTSGPATVDTACHVSQRRAPMQEERQSVEGAHCPEDLMSEHIWH